MSRPGEATLMGIPRELRQHIFAFVFEEPIAADLRLSKLLRGVLWTAGAKVTNLPFKREYNDNPKWEGQRTSFAPKTYSVAKTLAAVHPDLLEELAFVLNQQLNFFERAERADHVIGILLPGYCIPNAVTFLFISIFEDKQNERGNVLGFDTNAAILAYHATVHQLLQRFLDIFG